ncbi:sulfite exporter TauE/SafE family protein [Marinobacter sp. F3R11]|uniref:sulfite exporter TauE/SafE family protein n=1 Tax=Marinobacter sp. F3R11 TaxID=2267231 RepID=UPI001C9D9E1E|nr:sulfite exporter TauE/SafE family protein [Marinobacter sp. F3R11]
MDNLTEYLNPELGWAMLLILGAALVRGYTGFGFAAVAITGLNLVWPPQISVPVILLLDLIGSAGLLRSAWPESDRALIGRLSSGALLGIPLGLTLLIQLPETLLKLSINTGVLVMTLFLFLRPSPARREYPWLTRIAGGISGAFTSAASIGGLPIVCYLMSTPLDARSQRASMVVFLAATDLVALILMAGSGLLGLHLVLPILLLLVPTLLGVHLGKIAFHHFRPKSFHPVALPILAMLSISGLWLSLRSLLSTTVTGV